MVDDQGLYVPTIDEPCLDRGPEHEIVFVYVTVVRDNAYKALAGYGMTFGDECVVEAISWKPESGPYQPLSKPWTGTGRFPALRPTPGSLSPAQTQPFVDALLRANTPAHMTPEVNGLLREGSFARRRIFWPGVGGLALDVLRPTLGSLSAALAALCLLLWMGLGPAAKRRVARLHGHCPRCGYDLTGLDNRPCPECGSTDSAHRFNSSSSVVPAIAESYEHA